MIPQTSILENFRDTILNEQSTEVMEFIENHLQLNNSRLSILLDSKTNVNLKSSGASSKFSGGTIKSLVDIRRLNDLKYINKHLEESNEILPEGGLFIGNIDTLQNRKERIRKNYVSPINKLIYLIDFVVNRLFPKIRFTKKVYFLITQGKNRAISEMEIYGRLYSCGFELAESKEINGLLWFTGKKIDRPAYNKEATYGPLIKLKRHGKNNELFTVYKLRTMHPFSEYLQSYIATTRGLQKGGKFKNDPRVTTAGRFFRKFWLDEIPMFVNVFNGQMKIFGVRPLSSHYLNLYPEHLKELRAKVKPGLIPPFYADLPCTLEEITESEETYLRKYIKNPYKTDCIYFVKAMKNILIKRARSN